jgi:transposase
MPYQVVAIDVHKKMLAVSMADISVDSRLKFKDVKFSNTPACLSELASWIRDNQVQEVVMESTAQYWRPVWNTLERDWQPTVRPQPVVVRTTSGSLLLAQAKSNRGAKGRKSDFGDCHRLIRRLGADELILSYVPDSQQRLWRTVTRRKLQLTNNRVRLVNQLEDLLEQAQIKLSSFVSDLFGASALRMLRAIANGETDPATLASLGDQHLAATPLELQDALGACRSLNSVFRRLIHSVLEDYDLLSRHIEELTREAAQLMNEYRDAIERIAEVPGLGPDSALQILAELGPRAVAFPSYKQMASWIGVCPGQEESAGKSASARSPKGNRQMRRLLNQAAHAAVKHKGSVFDATFRHLLPRVGYKRAIWAVAHRLCRLLWLILHEGVHYQERGLAVDAKSARRRTARMIRELTRLGYRVTLNSETSA